MFKCDSTMAPRATLTKMAKDSTDIVFLEKSLAQKENFIYYSYENNCMIFFCRIGLLALSESKTRIFPDLGYLLVRRFSRTLLSLPVDFEV